MERPVSRVWFALACLLAPAVAVAQTPDSLKDSTARRIDELTREIETLRRELQDVAALAGGGQARQAPDQRYRQISGIASRPFVFRGAGAAVGGYVDLEFAREFDAGQTHFTQHRLIPFIFAEISDRLHFGTEIEFEYGGPQAPARDGEVKVEFAAFDLNLTRAVNFRAGALLVPLGKFNLTHDSPVNDLTDRPLVANRIVPTTLTDAGAGFWGQTFPSEGSVMSYEAYVVNGFNNAVISYAVNPTTGAITPTTNVRSARSSMRRDNNEGKSIVGRLAFSPALGVELGASGYTGIYSDQGVGRLSIVVFDAILARGRWELLGEVARASVSLDGVAERARALAAYRAARGNDSTGFGAAYASVRHVTAQQGAYVQANYHFGQGLAGFPNSTFTAVARVDHLDVDADADGDAQQRLSLGVNWRPIEQTAIKLDYQWNWSTPAGATDAGIPSNRLVASVATYF